MILVRAALVAIVALSGASWKQVSDPLTRPEPPSDGRGALAVLRRDGLILPFAAFNGDIWQILWPIDLTTREIPATLDAVPRRWWGTRTPSQWRAWLVDGADASTVAGSPIELQAPAIFRVHCNPRLGVRTNYTSKLPLPPAPVEPFPKDGIAVSGGLPIEPIDRVDRGSAEWAPFAVALLSEVNRVEDAAIKGIQANARWRHPVSRTERHTLPVILESWHRSPGAKAGETVSYVEVVRKYPPGPDDEGCGLETFVTGWVVHRSGTLVRPTQLLAKVTYCDRVGVSYMLPFGRIRPKERDYWVFQLSGWEEEWYEVAQIAPGKVRFVVEVFGGSRRSCPPI